MAQATPLGDAAVSLKQMYAGRPVHGQCAFRATLGANNREDSQKALCGSAWQRTEPAPGGTRGVPRLQPIVMATKWNIFAQSRAERAQDEDACVAMLTSMCAARRLPKRKRARTCKVHTFTQVALAGLRRKANTSTSVSVGRQAASVGRPLAS